MKKRCKQRNVLPDDLQVGEHVAVIGRFDGDPYTEYTGVPYRIEAVSLPFVAVSFRGQVVSIDVRDWKLGRVSDEYAKVVSAGRMHAKEPEPAAADGHARCVRCAERLAQKLGRDEKKGTTVWTWYCPKCGADHGAVPSTA